MALTVVADLQTQYTNYKNSLQSLAQKVGEVEQEIEEHKLVTETLQPLPQERKCFRLINGVLVERTVKDVLPALKTNSDGLKQVLDELVKQYKSKQDEMDKWKACPTHEGNDETTDVHFCRRRTTSRSSRTDPNQHTRATTSLLLSVTKAIAYHL